jgi:N-methylhydantoinase A
VGSGRTVGGRSLALPMVDVHTVGAGGGSIAWRDAGGALRVGPRSAGADPGPACYGRGGTEPTVTDADLVLGRLDSGSPLAGGVSLDAEAATAAVGGLADELGLEVEEAAEGIARVANAEMAQAVRVMTIERGIDPRELALVAFGGAGPLHAAGIAAELGMTRVIVPRAAGVLSALGLALAERRRDVVRSVLLTGATLTRGAVAATVAELGEAGRRDLGAPARGPRATDDLGEPAGGPRATYGLGEPQGAELRATFDLRYAGQAFELSIDASLAPEPSELRDAFDAAHERRYGYADRDAELELVTVRVAAATPGAGLPEPEPLGPAPRSSRAVRLDGQWHEAAVLSEGEADVDGPAIFELPGSTLVVPPGWRARSDADGVVMER